MSDEGEGTDGGSWWGGWLQTAKEQSASAWDMMKKDLVEFGVTVKRDTQATVASGASNIKEHIKSDNASTAGSGSKVKEGFSRLLSGITETLSPKDYGLDEDEKQGVLMTKDGAHIFDRKKAKLYAIQTEPGTYCNEPDGPPDHYEKWLESVSLEDNKGEISELLIVNTNVRSLYTKLVPAVVSHDDFWNRYFYKIHQLDQDEARKAALMERADMTSSMKEEEDLGWGDEEDDSWDTVPDAKPCKAQVEANTETTQSNLLNNKEENPITDMESLNVHDTDDGHNGYELGKDNSNKPGQTSGRLTPEEFVLSSEPNEEQCLTNEKKIDDDNNQGKKTDSLTKETHETHIEGNKVEEKTDDQLDSIDAAVENSSGNISPVSSDKKDSSSLGDDWDDFDDIEVTEEDVKAAANLPADDDLDDWENWE